MPLRDEWCDLARKLDWSFSYAEERQVYPEALSGTPWMLNVTSSCADSSVIGNALDRGDGTIRARGEDVLGLEAVLADGSILTTGGLTSDGRYRGQIAGPDLTQAIVQSNLAVVTAAVVALIARPQSVRLCHATYPRGAALAALDALASLVGTVPGLGTPRLRDLHLAGSTARTEWDSLSVLIPVLGEETVVDVVTKVVVERFAAVDGAAVIRCLDPESTPPDDPLYLRTMLAQGIPTCQLVRQALGSDSCDVDRDAAAGLLIALPLIPLDRTSPREALAALEELARDYPGTAVLELNVATTHTARAIVGITFDRASAEQARRAHALRDGVWQAFAGRMYRADIDHATDALRGPDDAANAAILDALKTALDPRDILLPGRFLASQGARP